VESIVAAYEHGLIFPQADRGRRVATNRDDMWNDQVQGAKLQRIDGEAADDRWTDAPGL
jgi:hypothetical protein